MLRMDTETAQPFTDEQWYRMCDMHMCRPIPLHEADLTRPFVYYRPWGLMYVPFGYHQHAMATMFAFHHGHPDYITAGTAMDIPGYRISETLADRFLLELEGTAFQSSAASRVITVGRPESLNTTERLLFQRNSFTIRYISED